MQKTQYDKEFENLSGLNWLPWIGEKYSNTKLLILGESLYEDGDEWLDENKEAPRTLIGLRFPENNKNKKAKGALYTKVEQILLDKSSPTVEEGNNVWKSSAYWILIQRLLPSRDGIDRPKDIDYDNGWAAFFSLIEVIKPEICLVLGKSSYGRLGFYLNNNETLWERNIDEFYPKDKDKIIINLTQNDHNLKLFFINHPTGSSGFSYEKWAQLINNREPTLKDKLAL